MFVRLDESFRRFDSSRHPGVLQFVSFVPKEWECEGGVLHDEAVQSFVPPPIGSLIEMIVRPGAEVDGLV